MKRNFLIVGAVVGLCLIAFYCGRAYQRPEPGVRIPAVVSPVSSPSQFVAPPDFGHTIYRDVATLPFVDLYEGLLTARPSSRLDWLNQIEEMAESPKKVAAIGAFFRALIQADPNAAGDLILRVKRHRGPAIHEMINAAPPAAMPRLAEILLGLPHEAREFNLQDHLQMALDEWAQVDPEAVLRFIAQHEWKESDDVETTEGKLSFQQYGPTVLHAWAGIEPEAALKWIESQPKEIADITLDPWLSGWFETDPDAAMSYGFGHLQDKRIADALPMFVFWFFDQSPAKTKEYVERLPAGEVREEALELIAHNAGYDDSELSPPAVAKLLIEFPVADWPSHFDQVLSRWLSNSPSEALDWISHLPPEIQAGVVEKFPEPMWDSKPEWDLLPVLELTQPELRKRLLQRVVAELNQGHSSPREIISKLQLSANYKAELSTLLRDAPPPTPSPPDSGEVQ